MVQLTINGEKLEVKSGIKLIEAARAQGLEIPSLCYLKELPGFTSCMLCIVKDCKSGKLIPSCSATVEKGMEIETDTPEVILARKRALELLLSEHVGDCEAPCRRGCPGEVNIPKVFRLYENNKVADAVKVLKESLPLPYTICSQCPATCEKVCRRGKEDYPVDIRDINIEIASQSITTFNQFQPNNRKIAVIGSGIAGISASWFLLLKGFEVTIYEKENQLSPTLREINGEMGSKNLVKAELEAFARTSGLKIELNRNINITDEFTELMEKYDGIIVATGQKEPVNSGNKLVVCDNSLKEKKLPPLSVKSGAKAVEKLELLLDNSTNFPEKPLDCRVLRPEPKEIKNLIETSYTLRPNIKVSNENLASKTSRCMHCECLRQDSCSLRSYASLYGAKQQTYKPETRFEISRNIEHPAIIYEAGKCIKCGICVRLTESSEEYGITFRGRGYDTLVTPPLMKSLKSSLTDSLQQVVEKCPTGAFSYRNHGV